MNLALGPSLPILREPPVLGAAGGMMRLPERACGMESSFKKDQTHTVGESLGSLLRELAGLLVDVPGEDPGERVARTGVSVERTAQVTGLQAILLPILTAPILALEAPSQAIGEAGWVLTAALLLIVIAMGVRLIRTPPVSGVQLAASNAITTAVLGLIVWLSGGFDSSFALLLPLVAAGITPHRPRLRRLLLAWIVLVALLPLAYDEGATDSDLADALMIAAASVGTLLTMVWLSARVRRSEVGLMDAAATAQVQMATAEATARRLLELDEIRDRLVSRVSHELRTPLTSIKGYLEALLEGESGDLDPEQRDLASVAHRNTVRLELLIGDLLLLSRMEAGQLELRLEGLDLERSLEDLREELSQLAHERSIELALDVSSRLVCVADKERLEQALTNLISNAIKYSPEGSRVLILARHIGREAVIEVIDRGVGIPARELNRLGERFFRASTAGAVKGTGLGVAITQELVELHGGRLEVESVVGVGSTFRIRLPLPPEPG